MNKRVIIVDFNHMAHTYFHSQHRLSVDIVEDGERITKDTTIVNGTIKNIHKWSNCGNFPTAVCFDRSVVARKAFFQANFEDMAVGTSGEYKGGRERMPEEMFQGIYDAEKILRNAGVSVFAEVGYEADDLIYACVSRAKEKYPGMPIDIITNDADLLPLVDDTVSVFIRSKKGTYAEEKSLEKLHYIQVTPRNFQEVVEGMSAFKNFVIPYNSVLLYKLLRGDSSDNYARKEVSRSFPPKKYNAMIERMLEDGLDFGKVFRYSDTNYEIRYKGTEKVFFGTLEEAKKSPDRAQLYQKICNSSELEGILDALRIYSDITDEQLSVVEKVYWGMNLNQTYPNPDRRLARRAYRVGVNGKADIEQFSEIELQKQLVPLKIRLKGLY